MSNEFVIRELSNQINLTEDIIRLYLGHFTLSKYLFRSYKYKSHPCFGIKLSTEFIDDFIGYLTTAKKRTYSKERVNYIKEKLEELLCQ